MERLKAKWRPDGRNMNNSAAPRKFGAARPVGRPSKYREAYAEMVYKLRLAGLPMDKIADIMDLSLTTIHRWRTEVAEFGDAWDRGGVLADAEIAHSLYHRAKGYSHEAEKIFYNAKEDKIRRAKYTEHYPPETQAISLWVVNRMPGLWKSARNANELSGPEGQQLLPPVIVIQPVWPGEEATKPTIDGVPIRDV